MSNPRPERVRYFDGEYLRAFDFTAEQAYHIETRRRLNVDLHLYGIATGLRLEPHEDALPPEAPMFVITTGFGIDQEGRELFVNAPYMLRTEDVLRKKGIQPGSNELWIVYKEVPAGLPAAGYQSCNDPDQNTRIRESFEILLVPIPKPAAKKGVELVDPDKERKGIRLGTVTVENGPDGMRISDAKNEKRTYIGIRAQRVKAADTSEDSFGVEKQNVQPGKDPLPGYIDVEPPLFLRGNVMAQKNAVIGDDFEVKAGDAISALPAMSDGAGKPETGNLKVARNLILGGQIVVAKDKKWYKTDEYIQTFSPDIVFGTATLKPLPQPRNPSDDVHPTIVVKSRLPKVSSAKVLVSMNGVKWVSKTAYNLWLAGITAGDPFQISVGGQAMRQGASLDTFDVILSWVVGPTFMPVAPAPPTIPVTEIFVSYLIIFYP